MVPVCSPANNYVCWCRAGGGAYSESSNHISMSTTTLKQPGVAVVVGEKKFTKLTFTVTCNVVIS